jgi:hypothetical protein
MEMNKAEYSKKDVWWIVTKTTVAVFMLTMIYSRFLSMEKEIVALKTTVNANYNYTNERVDKKTARNKEDIDGNAREITTLKQPNTDGNN